MDPAAHERLRRRIREIIAERHRDTHGGFLHLLPMAAAALPGIISAGKTLFGSGTHKPEAKTRRPNAHAQLVKKLMADAKEHGARLSLAEASRQAKAIREDGQAPRAPRARKPRASRKAAAPRKPRSRKEKIVLE